NMPWIARRRSQANSSRGLLREAIFQLGPCASAVHGAENAAAGPSVFQRPGIAAHTPQAGKQDHGIARIHHKGTHAGLVVYEENFLPGLAAISGAEDAALSVGGPGVPEYAYQHNIGITGIDDDIGDLSCIAQAHKFPGGSGVRGEEDAFAGYHVIANVLFARS